MASDPTVKVTFLGDTKGLKKAVDSADDDLGAFSKKVGDFNKKLAIGLTAAGVGVAFLAKSAVDAASDQNEALNKSSVVFAESAAEIEAWSKTAAKSMGLSKTEALAAAGSFGNLFDQLGISSKESAKMSKEMVGLAADFASFHNADITQVLEAQSAAFRGEFDALQRFVPTINAAAVAQKAIEMTGKKTTAALTEQDKALAVNALMFAGAGDAMGDFARTSDGAANQQRIMQARLADLQAEIGQKLLPVYQKLLAFILDTVIPGMERLGNWMDEHRGVVAAVAVVIGTVLVTAFIAWAVAAASAAAATIAAAAPVIAIGLAIAALAAGIIYAYTHWGWFKAAVDAVGDALVWVVKHFDDVLNVVKGVIDWITEHWALLLTVLLGPFGLALVVIIKNFDTIREAFADVYGFFVMIGEKLFNAIKGPFEAAFNFVKEVYNHTIAPIIDALKWVAGAFGGTAGPGSTQFGTGPGGSTVFGGGRAMGGPVMAGRSYLVGERGPEVFSPGQSGSISNGGGPQSITLNIDGRSFMTWLVEYSNDNGGLPVRIR